MTREPLWVGVAGGFVAFLVVSVAITAFARPWIDASLFLGIPAGFAAGVSVTTAVSLRRADGVPARRGPSFTILAGVSAALLLTIVLFVVMLTIGIVFALGILFVAGLVGIILALVTAMPPDSSSRSSLPFANTGTAHLITKANEPTNRMQWTMILTGRSVGFNDDLTAPRDCHRPFLVLEFDLDIRLSRSEERIEGIRIDHE